MYAMNAREKRTLTTVRLPAVIHEQLSQLARERKESMTATLTALLSDALAAQHQEALAPWIDKIVERIERRFARLLAKDAMESVAARVLVTNLYPVQDREKIWRDVKAYAWREVRWGGDGSASDAPDLAAGSEEKT